MNDPLGGAPAPGRGVRQRELGATAKRPDAVGTCHAVAPRQRRGTSGVDLPAGFGGKRRATRPIEQLPWPVNTQTESWIPARVLATAR